MKLKQYCILITLLFLNVLKCAKILGIFPCPGYSQYILGERLMVALAEKGHHVTVISDFETKGVQNFRNIITKVENNETSEALFNLQDASIFQNIDFIYYIGEDIVNKVFNNKDVQNLIKTEKETFDLVIAEQFYAEALFAFAPYYNAPLVVFNSMGLNEWNAYLVGNPNPPSYVSTCFSGYDSNLSFFKRTRNALAYLYDIYKKHYEALPYYQRLVDLAFPAKINLEKALYNVSLLLQNSHVSLTEAVPLTTAIKEIAGFHIKENPLPKDIKEFLDNAKQGAILFSMGSNLRSADLSITVLHNIFKELGKLKQNVLWKFETETTKNIPKNVLVSKWLPQSDILAHPNVVAFISHCGLLSTTESMYYGVPMIGIPVFGDQFTNIARIVKFGAGVNLPLRDVGHKLSTVVNEVVGNSSYKKSAMVRSKILRDRIVKPLDEAVYWIEYVLRHDGAPHLKNSILNLRWYEVYMLDIIGLFFIFVAIIFVIVFVSCKKIINFKLNSRIFISHKKRN